MLCMFYFKLINRYASETKRTIFVTNRSSTFVEFKLKRKDSYDSNQGLSKIQILYNQSKEFILRRTLLIIIICICGSYIDLS